MSRTGRALSSPKIVRPGRLFKRVPARNDVQLHRFGTFQSLLNSCLELTQTYQNLLDDGALLSQYLRAPLISDALDEIISQAFSTPHPHQIQLSSGDERNISISWVDVLRHADLGRIEHNEDDTYRCQVQEMAIRLTQRDYEVIKSGLLQKLIAPWPHPKDLLAESTVIESTIADVSQWNDQAMQVIGRNRHLLATLHKRARMLKQCYSVDAWPEHQSPPSGTLTATEAVNASAELAKRRASTPLSELTSLSEIDLEDGAATHSRASSSTERNLEVYLQPQGGSRVPEHSKKLSPRQPSVAGRWSADEEARLLPWLDARAHLDWYMIEKEYRSQFCISRSWGAIKRKAQRLRQKGHGSTCKIRRTPNPMRKSLIVTLRLHRTTLAARSGYAHSPLPPHTEKIPEGASDGRAQNTSRAMLPDFESSMKADVTSVNRELNWGRSSSRDSRFSLSYLLL